MPPSVQRSGALRLPDELRRSAAHLLRAAAELELELGRPPSEAELAERTQLSRARVAAVLARTRRAARGASLDAPGGGAHGDGGSAPLLDSVRSPAALQPAAELHGRLRRAALLEHVRRTPLTPRERTVLVLRFGLGEGGEGGERGERGAAASVAEVAVALGISGVRVRQLETSALTKLRDAAEPLRPLLDEGDDGDDTPLYFDI